MTAATFTSRTSSNLEISPTTMKAVFTLIFAIVFTASTAQKKDGIFQLDQDYPMSSTGTVKLSSSDAKVYITGSNRSNAHVKIYRQVTTRGIVFGQEEFGVDVYEDNGNLTIREKSNATVVGMVGYHYEKYEITLEVPEGASLQVKGDDGDYRIRNVDGKIAMDLDDADVELSACSGDSFRFQVDDGDITMDEGRGSLDIEADDGDVRISNAHFTSIIANVDDGDIEIETSLADKGEYRITGEDGLIALTITNGGGKFYIRHGDSRITTEGAWDQIHRSDDRTELVLANGDARVEIRSDDARVRLVRR